MVDFLHGTYAKDSYGQDPEKDGCGCDVGEGEGKVVN